MKKNVSLNNIYKQRWQEEITRMIGRIFNGSWTFPSKQGRLLLKLEDVSRKIEADINSIKDPALQMRMLDRYLSLATASSLFGFQWIADKRSEPINKPKEK